LKTLKTLAPLFALTQLLFISCDFNPDETLVKSKNYETADIERVIGNFTYENIEIITTNRSDILVEIMSSDEDRIPDITLSEKTLSIESEVLMSGFQSCSVYVYLPTDFVPTTTKVDTISGWVRIKDLSTPTLSITTTSGDITLTNISANKIDADSTSGTINTTKIETSSLDAETTSGNIKSSELTCDNFSINSTSGDATLNVKNQLTKDSSIRTISGQIKLTVPEDSNFKVYVKSTSGKFRDNIKDSSCHPQDSHTFTYGTGGIEISMTSTSGSITLN
jgi:DUF4097 and DUF4098 domain-containing protein YvlB